MTTGEHHHCFCSLNTAGQPKCCRCPLVLQSHVANLEDFIMWEKLSHDRAEAEHQPVQLKLEGEEDV